VTGPRENRHRPAIDPLFRSAARTYGDRVIGVVLTGALDDGAAGLRDITVAGGTAVVQDPEDAAFRDMPLAALKYAEVEHVVRLAELGRLLVRLVGGPPAGPSGEQTAAGHTEATPPEQPLEPREAGAEAAQETGVSSVYSCPECNGVLWEMQDSELLRFRCRVGHRYSADSLMAGQEAALETTVWAALRALEENASLARRLAAQANGRGHLRTAARFHERAQQAEQHAAAIKKVLSAEASHGKAYIGDQQEEAYIGDSYDQS
jgi:two-component system, chemotaxis family, protein-glutamate methylesterase/glutaminase